MTPAKLGIVYPSSATRRLVSLVGPATAKYLLFSGELIGAERALRTGLVDEVLPAGALDARVAEFTRILASRSLLTQAAAKEFADGRTGRDDHWHRAAAASEDTAEGVTAFLERRAPRFTWNLSAPRTPPSPVHGEVWTRYPQESGRTGRTTKGVATCSVPSQMSCARSAAPSPPS